MPAVPAGRHGGMQVRPWPTPAPAPRCKPGAVFSMRASLVCLALLGLLVLAAGVGVRRRRGRG